MPPAGNWNFDRPPPRYHLVLLWWASGHFSLGHHDGERWIAREPTTGDPLAWLAIPALPHQPGATTSYERLASFAESALRGLETFADLMEQAGAVLDLYSDPDAKRDSARRVLRDQITRHVGLVRETIRDSEAVLPGGKARPAGVIVPIRRRG